MNLDFTHLMLQASESFWRKMPATGGLWLWIVIGLVLGFGMFGLFMYLPSNMRRPIVWIFTFGAGLPYVLQYLWPRPIRADFSNDLPNSGEQIGFFINQMIDPVGKITNILQGFLLGVGIFSLVRVHALRVKRKSENWGFSTLLLCCFVLMTAVGFWDWRTRAFLDPDGKLNDPLNWQPINYVNDLLFDGLYQQMDAAMFSMIAFFILSAAYRAFRIRSVEATVMMASALILMLNLMGALTFAWSGVVDQLVVNTGNQFLLNLKLTTMADWLRANMQIPAIRAIEFGVGLGALAMGLRIWLGLEKGGVSV
ncbi:hypothetical protein QPK87_17615 [Kamptonema cortianum]|nr:hypothetical protein [Geitlerinema splendidum]MDK3158373.1 hypothetical protein [Kamptonema cortianum]